MTENEDLKREKKLRKNGQTFFKQWKFSSVFVWMEKKHHWHHNVDLCMPITVLHVLCKYWDQIVS